MRCVVDIERSRFYLVRKLDKDAGWFSNGAVCDIPEDVLKRWSEASEAYSRAAYQMMVHYEAGVPVSESDSVIDCETCGTLHWSDEDCSWCSWLVAARKRNRGE